MQKFRKKTPNKSKKKNDLWEIPENLSKIPGTGQDSGKIRV